MKTSKGISLPVNMIVIVALAVVVLLAATAFFYGGFGRTSTITTQNAWDTVCQRAKQRGGCAMDAGTSNSPFQNNQMAFNDIDNDGENEDILEVCQAQYGFSDSNLAQDCKQQCCNMTG